MDEEELGGDASVRDPLLRVMGARPGGKCRENRVLDLLARKGSLGQRRHPPIHADRGRRARYEQQVASSTLVEDLEPPNHPRAIPLGGGFDPVRIQFPKGS